MAKKQKALTQKPNTAIFFMLYLGILALSPFFRGLFFEEDQLIVYILSFAVFLVYAIMRFKSGVPFSLNLMDLSVAALAACYLISSFMAIHYRLAIAEFIKYFHYFILYLMFKEQLDTQKNRNILLNVIYAAITAVSLLGLLAAMGLPIGGAYSESEGWINSNLQYHNAFGALALSGIAVGIALFAKTENLKLKFLYIASAFILFYGFIFSNSRGAWVMLPIVYLILLIFMWKKGLYSFIIFNLGMFSSGVFMQGFWEGVTTKNPLACIVYLAAGVILTVLVTFLLLKAAALLQKRNFNMQRFTLIISGAVIAIIVILVLFAPSILGMILPENILERLQNISFGTETVTERFVFYADGLTIASNYPVFGAGGGAWESIYRAYQTYNYASTQAHSSFIQILIEVGAVGFLVFLSVLAFYFWFAFKNLKRYRDNEDHYYLVLASLAGGLALILHSVIDFDLSLSSVTFILFAYIAVISALLPNDAKNSNMKLNTHILSTACGILLIISIVFTSANSFHKYGIAKIGSEPHKSLSAFQTAAALDPFHSKYKLDYATLLINANSGNQKVLKEAGEIIEQAVGGDRYDYYTNYIAGNYYLIAKDYDLAAYYTENLLKLDPQNAISHNDAIDFYSKIYAGANSVSNKALADTAVKRIIEIYNDVETVNQNLEKYNRPFIGLTEKTFETVEIFRKLYNINS